MTDNSEAYEEYLEHKYTASNKNYKKKLEKEHPNMFLMLYEYHNVLPI